MTRQQKWAQEAFNQVTSVCNGTPIEIKKKFKTVAMKAPNLLTQCGVCQTIVFYTVKSKGEDESKSKNNEFKLYLDAIEAVYNAPNGKEAVKEPLDKLSRVSTLTKYLSLSRDLIECSIWIRRFVQSEMADIEEE